MNGPIVVPAMTREVLDSRLDRRAAKLSLCGLVSRATKESTSIKPGRVRASNWPINLLPAEGVRRSSRAAAEKFPASTTRTNTAISLVFFMARPAEWWPLIYE